MSRIALPIRDRKATAACAAGFFLWPPLTFVLRRHWRRARRRYFGDVVAAEQRRLHDLESWATEEDNTMVNEGGHGEAGAGLSRSLGVEMIAAV